MSRGNLLMAVMLVSLFNGIASPAVLGVMLVGPVWMPAFIPISVEVLAYGASLIVAFATLLIAGVPAALYERCRGQAQSDATSLLIWLGAAVLLSLPAIGRFV